MYKLYKRGLHPDCKRWKSFLPKSINNPHLDKEEIKATKDNLSDDLLDRNMKLDF